MTENGFGTQDILTGRGLGIGGFGNYGHGSYAGPSVNASRINRNAQQIENQGDCTRMAMGMGLDRVSDQAEESRRAAQFNSITDNMFRAELRGGDRVRDLEREMNSNMRVTDKNFCDVQKAIADAAKDAAKCCCDAQLLANSNHAATMAAIASIDSRNVERALNNANAELTSLKTQVACGCCTSK